MNIKKKLSTLSLSALALGTIALTNAEDADATTWEARTVEEIRQDINALDDGDVAYTIQWGDTLSTIATATGLPLETLVEINAINNADLIIVNNTIYFSAEEETVTIKESASNEEKTYDVSENKVEEITPVPVEDTTESIEEPAPIENTTEEIVEPEDSAPQAVEQPAKEVHKEPSEIEVEEESVQEVPVQEEPAVENEESDNTGETTDPEQTPQAMTVTSNTSDRPTEAIPTSVSSPSVSETAAKEEIARRESNGSYDARNGVYIGRYQLHHSYLDADYSPANQERVADAYVADRYGSWGEALAHWNAIGWY